MKIFKRIIYGLIGLVVLLLITALFVKNDYQVQEEVVVNQPKTAVFNYVKFAKNHDHFNKWIMQDPQIKKSYRGTDGTAGFVYAWNSEGEAGQGEQETKNIAEGERVDFNIHFIRPMEADATMYFTTNAVAASQTKVQWTMNGRSPYPLNIMNLFIPGMLGKDMMASLTTLKSVLEK
jgi:hypothetical protein